MSDLMPNEQVIIDTELHWIIFFWPLLIVLALLYFILHQHVWFPLSYLAALLVIYVLGDVFFRYMATHYTLTSARVIKKTGVVRTQIWDIGLSRIESVRLQQTLMGKLFGYGDVIVSGIGGDQMLFALVDEPRQFQQAIFQAMEQNKHE